MRLKTTVRPRPTRGEEYDLDIVVEIASASIVPMELYRMVMERLKASPEFRGRLRPLNRCLRLEYAGFHLDILPARRDPSRLDGCIEVPDRELRDWHPSNPSGYASWFEDRCAIAKEAVRARVHEPLPEPEPEDLLVPLRRAVQLIKRRRDNSFGDDGGAPRSVVLTTLAGGLYDGRASTVQVLQHTLDGIAERAVQAERNGRRLVVLNPSHEEEDFSERWDTEPGEYRKFRDFVAQFARELATLQVTEGLDEIGKMLNQMFGNAVGTQAVATYMRRVRETTDARAHRYVGPAVVLGGTTGRKPAAHTFHDGE